MQSGQTINYTAICDHDTYGQLCRLFRSHSITRAVLFGSFARGDESRRSDIDLMLVQDTSKRFFDRYEPVYRDISRLLGSHPVDLLIYTEEELDALRSRKFIQAIEKEGVAIYEQEATAS